jgi:hypothetical protein
MRFGILLIVELVGLGFLVPQFTPMIFAQSDIPMQEVPDESNDQTGNNTTGTDSGNITGTEQMTLKAQMKPAGQFLKDLFEIKKFGFVASNGSEICPQNNCKYGVDGAQFSQFGGKYFFHGKLKVTTQEGDTKKSKFYDFSEFLDKTSEEERNGQTIETLGGTFAIGPGITYVITNATLKVDDKNPVLTIQGERS